MPHVAELLHLLDGSDNVAENTIKLADMRADCRASQPLRGMRGRVCADSLERQRCSRR